MVTLDALISALGGNVKVAAECNVGPSAVSNWVARGAISAEHRLTVWRLASDAGIDWAPPGFEGLALVKRVRPVPAPADGVAA